jgi:hypothetical protein
VSSMRAFGTWGDAPSAAWPKGVVSIVYRVEGAARVSVGTRWQVDPEGTVSGPHDDPPLARAIEEDALLALHDGLSRSTRYARAGGAVHVFHEVVPTPDRLRGL